MLLLNLPAAKKEAVFLAWSLRVAPFRTASTRADRTPYTCTGGRFPILERPAGGRCASHASAQPTCRKAGQGFADLVAAPLATTRSSAPAADRTPCTCTGGRFPILERPAGGRCDSHAFAQPTCRKAGQGFADLVAAPLATTRSSAPAADRTPCTCTGGRFPLLERPAGGRCDSHAFAQPTCRKAGQGFADLVAAPLATTRSSAPAADRTPCTCTGGRFPVLERPAGGRCDSHAFAQPTCPAAGVFSSDPASAGIAARSVRQDPLRQCGGNPGTRARGRDFGQNPLHQYHPRARAL
jgi:hypothetical protein